MTLDQQLSSTHRTNPEKALKLYVYDNKQTLALRQASEGSACFHSSVTIKTSKRIYFS